MPHFLINSVDIEGNLVTIKEPETYRHIAKSLRAKTGERLLLIDENEFQYETVIEKITSNEIVTKINKSYKSTRKLGFDLYLAQSVLRSDAQNTLIEKATELGVCGVYPLLTDNCAVASSIAEKKVPKWQKIMFEASKQCERANIPECFVPANLENLIEERNFDYVIAFCERLANVTLRNYVQSVGKKFFDKTKILVIVGPEGGFSQREFEFFHKKNITMLTLGDLILKADTAVTVALGNIINEYNSYREN